MSFSAGQRLTASVLNASLGVQTAGGLWRVTNAAATSGTTELAFATTPTLALAASSTYEVWADLIYVGSVTSDQFIVRIRDTNVAGTVRVALDLPVIVSSSLGPWPASYSYTFTTSVAANFTFAATVQRFSGTGTLTAASGSKCQVRLLGSSSVFATA